MLHPVIAAALAAMPAPPPGPIDPVGIRAFEESLVPPLEARTPQVRSVRDLTASTDAGDVPVRIYVPDADEPRGLALYLHGGAFFLGSLNTHDHIARRLTVATGLTVVSVGYRLAPEARFPAGLDDCYGVLRWAVDNADALAWDGRTLALVGDSSGANLVAALTHRAADDDLGAITHQVLLYPSLDLDFDATRYPSLTSNAAGYGLETALLKPFNAFYVNSGADPDDPRVSPIKRANLAGLPPALIITAEHDPLRDEGELYGRRLTDAGVPVLVNRYAGANHGFVQHFGDLPEFARVYDEIAAFVKAPQA